MPLIPYYAGLAVQLALPLSLLVAAVMLSVTGFMIAVTASLNIKKKIVELLVAGMGSALATYTIGRLASILLGIEIS